MIKQLGSAQQTGQTMLKCGIHFVYKYLYIHSVYTICIHDFYNIHFLQIRIDVYKIYTKCLHTKCIQHFDRLLYTIGIQNLAAIVLLILYTKCIQKFSEMEYTFCVHFVYIYYTSVVIICTIFVYKMQTQFLCIQTKCLRS